ncbi:MAG: Rha family transcriptional regulator [Desulfamplus sp.]|nr:Rha family transcriptional regulator [Desulfamplus sp.]
MILAIVPSNPTSELINPTMAVNNTMTSREIAELTKKNHFHIMRDIKTLIADEAVSDVINDTKLGLVKIVSYKDAKGEMREMYELDFKATMTLVTGYDAKRRSLIINRWIELETGKATPAYLMTDPDRMIKDVLPELQATIEMAKLFGLQGNQALLSANKAIRTYYGVDCMDMLDIKGLESLDQKQYFSPSYIGLNCFSPVITPIMVNKKLKEAGLQIETRDSKNKLIWVMTEAGKEYGNLIDVDINSKEHSSKKKTPIQQLKWITKVATLIGGESIHF